MKRISLFALAFKNLRRKPARTFLLIAVMTLVSGTLFGATIFFQGMRNSLNTGMERLGADIIVISKKQALRTKSALLAVEPSSAYMPATIAQQVRQTEGVQKASAQLYMRPATFSCCYNPDAYLVAFDSATDFTLTPWLTKALGRPLAANEIITGSGLPVVPGDKVPFFGTTFAVAGTLETTGMEYFDMSAYMTMEAAHAMAEHSKTAALQPITLEHGNISSVLVQIRDGETPERVALRIEHALSEVQAVPADTVMAAVKKQMQGILKATAVFGILLYILAILLLGLACSIMVNERQREFGLLRAMGARKGHTFRLVVTEIAMLSLAGGCAGGILGSLLLYSFRGLIIHSMKLPYLFPALSSLLILLLTAIFLSLATGICASLVPAYSVSRREPYEAIRRGE